MSRSAKFKIGDIVAPSAYTLDNKTGKIINKYWQQLNNGIVIEAPPTSRHSLYGVYWDIGMIDYSLARELKLITSRDTD